MIKAHKKVLSIGLSNVARKIGITRQSLWWNLTQPETVPLKTIVTIEKEFGIKVEDWMNEEEKENG